MKKNTNEIPIGGDWICVPNRRKKNTNESKNENKQKLDLSFLAHQWLPKKPVTVSTYEIQIGGDLRWLWFRRGGVDGGGGRDAGEGRRRKRTGSDDEDGEPEIAIGLRLRSRRGETATKKRRRRRRAGGLRD
ncbi:hypothetical protein U1Q18_013245 [Sarracenia purpurea var. burkii]